jgi:hypothetical protein
MMAIERRRVTTQDAVWQRIFPPQIATTDGTPTVIYQGVARIPEGRFAIIKATIGVWLTADTSKASSIDLQAIIARATGGNIRLAATNFRREDGELTPAQASASVTVDTATQKFAVVVTGKAATNLSWLGYVEIFRNN